MLGRLGPRQAIVWYCTKARHQATSHDSTTKGAPQSSTPYPHHIHTCAACGAGRGGAWLSLLDHPHVPDDSELLGLFEDVAGITFLDAPGTADQATAEQGNQSDR